MARPKLHSDDEILSMAQAVLVAKGPAGFTLSDVAEAVGVSRAAIIQRFENKTNLHRRVMERSTQEVRDYFAARPVVEGIPALRDMLSELIAGMGEGEGFAGYLLLEWSDVHDEALNRLAQERNRLVREAIAVRLPESPEQDVQASLIQAVIQGATMQWLIEPQGPLNGFVEAQTFRLLDRLFPGA
ncbi:TetR family transcriptional regulator [Devosia sp. 17-2-E-8]|nr:TetR family transcriptional regulator [Devosia sp. 17-2-E-8]